jgi:hypothetical protein
MLKLIWLVLSYLLGLYGSYNGVEFGSVLWLLFFLRSVFTLLMESSWFFYNLPEITKFIGMER